MTSMWSPGHLRMGTGRLSDFPLVCFLSVNAGCSEESLRALEPFPGNVSSVAPSTASCLASWQQLDHLVSSMSLPDLRWLKNRVITVSEKRAQQLHIEIFPWRVKGRNKMFQKAPAQAGNGGQVFTNLVGATQDWCLPDAPQWRGLLEF